MAKNISSNDFLSTTSSNLLMLCKDLRELQPNHNTDHVIDGSFKITLLTFSVTFIQIKQSIIETSSRYDIDIKVNSKIS